MNALFLDVRKKIIDTLLGISLVYLVLVSLFSILFGVCASVPFFCAIYLALSIIVAIIFLLRKKIAFRIKTHAICINIFVLSLLFFNYLSFADGSYFSFVLVFISGILMGRKYSIGYFILSISIFTILVLTRLNDGFSRNLIFDNYFEADAIWVYYFSSLFYLVTLIVFSVNNFYACFLNTIEIKNSDVSRHMLNEKRLQTIIDNIPALVFIKSQDGVYKFANNTFVDFFNIKMPIRGKTDYDFFAKERALKIKEEDEYVISKKENLQFEVDFVLNDKPYTFLNHKSTLINEAGDIEILGVSVDISERKKTEKALKDSQYKLFAVLESSKDMIYSLDTNYCILTMNTKTIDRFKEFVNTDISIGDNILHYIPENVREVTKMRYDKALSGQAFNIETFNVINDNTFYADISFSPIWDNNRVTGISIVRRDITEKRLLEKTLTQTQIHYIELMNWSGDGISYWRLPDGCFLDLPIEKLIEMIDNAICVDSNKAFGYFHGIKNRADMLGKSYKDFANNRNFVDCIQLFIKSNYHVENYETSQIMPNGEVKYFLETWFGVLENNRLMSVWFVAKEVTQLKNIELELIKHRDNLEVIIGERTEQLRKTNEELNLKNIQINNQNKILEQTIEKLQNTQTQLIQSEKMASLGVLIAGVAHEINNPLNFINAGLTGLEFFFAENNPQNAEEVEPLLNGIRVGVKRASKIIKGLNQFSWTNRSPFEICDIHAILNNCLIALNNQTLSKIKIIKQYNAHNFTLRGNIGKLHQAFLSILTNAVQAIEKNGLITVSTILNSHNIIIDISDNGCGIPPEILSKITDPFFTTKEPGKGTGLGLSTTLSIVHEHKGKLIFDSTPGVGTNVKVVLPIE